MELQKDNTEHLRELGELLQRRLHILEQQAAYFGPRAPAEILMEIQDIKAKLGEYTGQAAGAGFASYDQGKDLFDQFWSSLDSVQDKLGKAAIREERVIRLFGIPIYTFIRTVTLLAIVAACGATTVILSPRLLLPIGGAAAQPTSNPVATVPPVASAEPTDEPVASIDPTDEPTPEATPTNPPLAGAPSPTPLEPSQLPMGAGVPQGAISVPGRVKARALPSFDSRQVSTVSGGDRVELIAFTDDPRGVRWYRLALSGSAAPEFWLPALVVVRGETYATVHFDDGDTLPAELRVPYAAALQP
jgi:hypothetical protein